VLGDLGALGGDEQAHAGVARGVRRRRNRASAAALRLRRCGIQAGMGLGRERRARRSSPATRFERKEAGEGVVDGEGEVRRAR